MKNRSCIFILQNILNVPEFETKCQKLQCYLIALIMVSPFQILIPEDDKKFYFKQRLGWQ